jgi:hypothetical protein
MLKETGDSGDDFFRHPGGHWSSIFLSYDSYQDAVQATALLREELHELA